MRKSMHRVKLYAISIAIFIFLSSCQTLLFDGKAPSDLKNLDNAFIYTYSYEEPVNITKDDFFHFIENMKFVYLDFARGHHKTFVPNTEIIKDGTIIENTEQVSNQFVSHKYRISINRNDGLVTWVSNPSTTIITPLNFKIETATVLYLKYDVGKFSTKLELIFGSKKDYRAALNVNAKELWDKHNNREMENAVNIMIFLKKSGQLYNDPQTWNLAEIRSKLK